MIDRQQQVDAFLHGFFQQLAGQFDSVFFNQGFTDGVTLGAQEGIGHAAADDQGIDFLQQVLDYGDLVADLGAAEHRNKRMIGIGEGLAEVEQFLLQQEAGDRRLHRITSYNVCYTKLLRI